MRASEIVGSVGRAESEPSILAQLYLNYFVIRTKLDLFIKQIVFGSRSLLKQQRNTVLATKLHC